MRGLDWVVYILALGVVLWGLLSAGTPDEYAPPPPPEVFKKDGPLLPDPSALDNRILIQVDEPRAGIGTAFAVDNNGRWLTARHVVDGCDEVGILIGPNTYVPALSVETDSKRDLALITTGRSPLATPIDLESQLKIGQPGYHVGYPQGRPGEVSSRLLSRSKLISRGYRRGEEPVLAWVEMGRTRGLVGSLGGLSGGPVFDENGQVRGVIVAESPRRGRIYTAAPHAVAEFLENRGITPNSQPSAEQLVFDANTYDNSADLVRRELQVVKVACSIEGGADGRMPG